MKVLCPYCGHHQDEAEQCESCKGLFEPLSRTASQIAMGPWFVRNDSKPFLPGFSVATLRRLITAGRVTPDSILRGPSTHQLWSYARHAPGVAHLMGLCHSCCVAVEPTASACPSCGAMFTTPEDRESLGLPTTSIRETVSQRLARNAKLCPLCANEAVEAGRCGSCESVFEPADAATRITLGPWQVRDTKLPLRTGMSHDELRRMIDAGEVTGDSIIRGPSTHQFFSLVRQTPGVSQLVGKCHACGAFVTSAAERCDNCSAPLATDTPPDRLGLLFKTDQQAVEAQRRLDAQVAAINDPVVQKPVPIATPKKKSDAPAATKRESAPKPEPAPAPSSSVPAHFTDALAEHAAPRGRHAVAKRKRSNPLVFVVTGLATLLAFGSVFFVILKGGGDRDPQVVQEVPDEEDRTAGPQEPTAVQQRNFNAYKARFDEIDALDSTERFKPLVAEARRHMTEVRQLWDAGRIDEAAARFAPLLAAIRAVEEVEEARQRAFGLRDDSGKLRATAEGADAPQIAPEQWKRSQDTVAEAAAAFDAEKYESAEGLFRHSLERYREAIAHVEAFHESAAMRKRFDATLTRTFTREQIEAGGGDLLAEAMAIVAQADRLQSERKYGESLAAIRAAHAKIEQIELAVKRAIGVHYWAVNTGHLVADTLLRRAAGKGVSDDDRGRYADALANLGLPPLLAGAVPTAPDAPFADLAKVMVESTAAAIAEHRGSDVELSFQLGIQLRLLEQLLDQPGDLMSPQDDSEVRRIVTVMGKQAESAGYPQPFFDRIDEVKKLMLVKPKYESVRRTQAAAVKLRKDLAEFEKAMAIIPIAKR